MSPPSPAEQRLQEISHLFLSTGRAGSSPPSPLQSASVTSEPRRSLPPRVIAVGSATDPLVTTFTACRLAVELRARGRRVFLFDGAGQPWFLRQLLTIEGEPERTIGMPDLAYLRQRGLTWCSMDGAAEALPAGVDGSAALSAAEAEADMMVVVLPSQSLVSYLGRYPIPRQEFLVVTGTSEAEVGRAFARLREVGALLPGARVGALVVGADRMAAEGCFDRLAGAVARLLRVSLYSYGYFSLASRDIRELAAGRPLVQVEETRARAQMAALADLLIADGRPRSQVPPGGWFFDAHRGRAPVSAGGHAP
jgi:hypothetical protein